MVRRARTEGGGNFVEKRGLAALKKQRKKQYRIRLTRRRLNKGRGSGVETTKYIKYRCNKERKEPKGNIQLRGTKREKEECGGLSKGSAFQAAEPERERHFDIFNESGNCEAFVRPDGDGDS